MKTAAIYPGVSYKQKEGNTIASQTATSVGFARREGYDVPRERIFGDEGFGGASLIRPGLERPGDTISPVKNRLAICSGSVRATRHPIHVSSLRCI